MSDNDSLTVDQWAAMLFPPTPRGAPHRNAWKHAAAAALHNWRMYAHHHNGPMVLSRADYDAALKATETVNQKGASTPHAPAYYGENK